MVRLPETAPDQATQRLARRIRRLRKQAGLSQEQLGLKIGLPMQRIQEIESSADGYNGRRVKLEERGLLADTLGTTADVLFADLGSQMEPTGTDGAGTVSATGSGAVELAPGDLDT
jgi:transcriptional regulator with XRE-family HTH domain